MPRAALSLSAAVLLFAPACVGYKGPTQQQSDAFTLDRAVTDVVLRGGAGDVVIDTGAELVEVERYAEWSNQAPDVDAFIKDDVLYLEDTCDGWGYCRVDYVIRVPAGTDLDLELGSGDLRVTGADARTRVAMGSGDLLLSELSGEAIVAVGSGDIEGDDMALVELRGETGSGDVELEYREAPALVALETGSGDVTLDLPAADYALELSTGSGDIDLDGVQDTQGAERLLQLHTGSGDIEIVAW